MVNVFEPNDPLLKKYVNGIYIYERGMEDVKYTAYPSTHTAVGLFRNTVVEFCGEHFSIKNTGKANYFGAASNRLFKPLSLHYDEMVDEIAINFSPVGFAAFAQWNYNDSSNFFIFSTWDDYLKELLNAVFASDDQAERLNIIEAFLLKRYVHIDDEEMLVKAIGLLNNPANNYKVQEIAKMVGVHYKYLYRSFMQHIGCSPAHYRKIEKFRRSVYSKLDQGNAAKFIEICYDSDYTDQAYFIKQFQELTGENPKKFFRDISSFGKNKVVFRFL